MASVNSAGEYILTWNREQVFAGCARTAEVLARRLTAVAAVYECVEKTGDGWMRFCGGEGGGEFFVDVAEAAVGEDGDDVAGAEAWGEVGDDGVGVGAEDGGDAAGVEGGDDVFGVEALGGGDGFGLEDGGEEDFVGEGEESTSSRSKTLRRRVLERGSRTAQRRRPG